VSFRAALVLAGVFAAAGCAAGTFHPAAPEPKSVVAPNRPIPENAAKSRFPSDRAAVVHVLNRFAYGPRPADVESVSSRGTGAWILEQLDPEKIADPASDRAIAPYRAVLAPVGELPTLFPKVGMEDDPELENLPFGKQVNRSTDFKRLIQYTQSIALVRKTLSERQLYEVMVDLWTNHFNVFARKGLARIFAANYVEHAIRPHALGRFDELLLATARHPAMLIYLDNAQSVAPREHQPAGRRRGITENYARELLELHTLGADGGFTQDDVVDVARIFTGWSVARSSAEELGFVFRARVHDRGAKTVLGWKFAPGGGEEEGVELVRRLASHPATARNVARKLCARFVLDQPPPGCVERVSRAFLESGGNLRACLSALIHGADFWAEENRKQKVKSPVEFMVSALRAVGATIGDPLRLVAISTRLAEPPLLELAPTGYPEAALEWASSSGALMRMNYANQLSTGKIAGVTLDYEKLWGAARTPGDIVERLDRNVFLGQAKRETLRIIAEEAREVDALDARRALALALALGSPDFQKQ
jgi:hypothetical protein